MDTITGIKDLDAYLVSFFDQNTIYNYSLLTKETNQIATGHKLFKMLREYQKVSHDHSNILSWAIRIDEPYVLDWYFRIGFKFVNVFVMVDKAVRYSSIKILDWFYQRGMFDYTLQSLHYIVLNGEVDSIDWFYEHGLETSYLNKMLTNSEIMIRDVSNHKKILKILKWLQRKKYSFKLDARYILCMVTADSIELIKWLTEQQLIDNIVLASDQYTPLFDMKDLSIDKQIETLTLLKNLGCCFNETRNLQLNQSVKNTLFDHPIEIRKWCMKNIPGIGLEHIFGFAAKSGDIDTMKLTGIDKNHQSFDLINHNYILEQAINKFHLDVIDWYFENIQFNDRALNNLQLAFENAHILTIETIMLFEKYFNKYNYCYVHLYPTIIVNEFRKTNIIVVEYLLHKLPSETEVCIDTHDISYCISKGHIESLKWIEKYLDGNILAQHEIPDKIKLVKSNFIIGVIISAINRAVVGGYIETLKWAKHFIQYKFYYKTMINLAASTQNFDILNWLNKLLKHSEFEYSKSAIDNAIPYDMMQTIKWFESSGHPLKYSTIIIENSIRYKKIHILQWFKENKYPMIFNLRTIHIACESHITALQWLKDNGVIKIVDRQVRTDLLVFKIELSQPFANLHRQNAIFYAIEHQLPSNSYFGVKYIDNPNSVYLDNSTRPVEIRFRFIKFDHIFTSQYISVAEHQSAVYRSLQWFERQYKQLIHQ